MPYKTIKAIRHEGKGMVFMVCASVPRWIRQLAIRCVTLLDIIKFSQFLIPQKKSSDIPHCFFSHVCITANATAIQFSLSSRQLFNDSVLGVGNSNLVFFYLLSLNSSFPFPIPMNSCNNSLFWVFSLDK